MSHNHQETSTKDELIFKVLRWNDWFFFSCFFVLFVCCLWRICSQLFPMWDDLPTIPPGWVTPPREPFLFTFSSSVLLGVLGNSLYTYSHTKHRSNSHHTSTQPTKPHLTKFLILEHDYLLSIHYYCRFHEKQGFSWDNNNKLKPWIFIT